MMERGLDTLLWARLWVARLGELDVLRWWRSDGLLGPDGGFVGPRLLPRTHGAARARIAFAVARHACDVRYPNAAAWHLFRLGPEIEDAFDALLAERCGDSEWWHDVLARLEPVGPEAEAAATLIDAQVVTEEDVRAIRGARAGPEERSLKVEPGASLEVMVRRLAAGFTRSAPGALMVPWVAGAG